MLRHQRTRSPRPTKHGSDTMAELATDLTETQQKLKERGQAAAEQADEDKARSRSQP